MQIAIDLSTRSVLSWTGEPITALSMTCRDRFPVDLRFISGGRFVELPEDAAGKLSMKVPEVFAGLVRATAESWVKSVVARVVTYQFFLRLDTVELLELFLSEPESVNLAMEVEWSYGADPTVRQTSTPVPVVVLNDYIRETDGVPVNALDLKATKEEAEAGADNDKWMTPLRTAQAIQALAATDWDSITGKPAEFPPEPHAHQASDITDFDAAVAAFALTGGTLPTVIDGGTF
jgi:hypothetical protein